MKSILRAGIVVAALGLPIGAAYANRDTGTIDLFHQAGQSASYFDKSYGYAVFPTIGQGGFVVGAAHGDGDVYVHGRRIGKASVTQVSVGFQAGGQAYSEIIFFQDKASLEAFTTGNFELGADVGAIAVTASASAGASTDGEHSGASGGMHDAVTQGGYYRGMAIFTIAKGGLMFDASVQGQKFSYTPRASGRVASNE
jgi:lipid-binding SYLF domain-containing protein